LDVILLLPLLVLVTFVIAEHCFLSSSSIYCVCDNDCNIPFDFKLDFEMNAEIEKNP
jgi:hypothetical protein